MKKLMLLVAACCFVFVSCNNKPAEPAEETEAIDSTVVEEPCCQMTEEEKAFVADWENWANQTDERKAELIAKKKECFDNRMAEMQAKKAECEAKKAEMEGKLANWATMSLDEQKAFLDEYAPCCNKHEGCGHHEGGCQHDGGCGHHEGGCQHNK